MKKFSSLVLNLALLCIFLGPLLAIAAPNPMWKAITGKGKAKAENSSSTAEHFDPKDVDLNSKHAIIGHGRAYRDSVEAAISVVDQGHKPSDARLRHNKPYIDTLKRRKRALEHLEEKVSNLKKGIEIGGPSQQRKALDRDLGYIHQAMMNSPHTHPSIANLPLELSRVEKEAALKHLNQELDTVVRLLMKYKDTKALPYNS